MGDVAIDLNNDDDYINEEIYDLGIASVDNDNILCNRNLKDYPQHSQDDENSSFVNLIGNSGIKTVRKSSLIWNMSTNKERVSSDRLKRVRGTKRKSCHQLEFVDVSAILEPLHAAEKIKIGDWCIFTNVFDETPDTFILGNIISFQYAAKSKAYKDRKYTWDFASVSPNENDPKKMDVLSFWYRISANASIELFKLPKCTFVSMDDYLATLLNNVIQKNINGSIYVSQKHLLSVQNRLKELKK